MHRTDADGATVSNTYTEGDASLSIPATVVSAAAANSWQEELAGIVEASGLTLLTSGTDTFDQVLESIKILIQNGGSIAPINQTLANNSSNQDVEDSGVDIQFDRTVHRSAQYDYYIERKTDSSSVAAKGTLTVIYDPEADTWKIFFEDNGDAHGVVFSLAAGSTADKQKLLYTTDDLTGTSYAGSLRLSNFKEVRI